MCTDQTCRCILQDASTSLGENKEFGSLRNEENKISLNEINEVLEEEDEGQHNKLLIAKVRNWKITLKTYIRM